MSTTIIASIISILVIVLPWFGVHIGTDQLTELVQGVVVIGSAIWVWYQRTKLVHAPAGHGDVNALGIRR